MYLVEGIKNLELLRNVNIFLIFWSLGAKIQIISQCHIFLIFRSMGAKIQALGAKIQVIGNCALSTYSSILAVSA